MKEMRLFSLVFLLVCVVPRVYAQYAFQKLDNSNGLSNSCINSIFEDSDRIMWFGTWDGLNFYDGSNVHVFNYEKTDAHANSIASNVIYNICEDKKRNIWIGTVEGLSRFNKNSGNFSNYFYNRKRAMSNGYGVAIDRKGTVYAFRENSEDIFRYDAGKDKFERITIPGLQKFMLIKMLFDEHNNLWLLKDKGILEVFENTPGGFRRSVQWAAVNGVQNMILCNHHLFYLSNTNELNMIDGRLGHALVLRLPHEVRSMCFYKDRYLFAWASKGLGEYTADFKPATFLAGQSAMLQNIRITTLLNDDKLLWLGTDGNGVIKVGDKENYFGVIQNQPNGQSFHIPVRAFCNVNNQLWVGTKGNGIITIKNLGKKDVSFSTISSFHTNVDLLDNCVYSIVKGNDGLVYIGSDANGITLYDERLNKFIKWDDIADSKRYPAFSSVHCILYDQDGSVWLGLNETGLVHLKLFKDEAGRLSIRYFKQYIVGGATSGPGSNVIYSLAASGGKGIWVGCRYGGLSYFDKTTQTFKTFKAFSYDGSLSNNDVLSLFIDKQHRLWAGTSFGLNWIREAAALHDAKPVFKKLTVEDGLPNNTIHAISDDDNGSIWISTNKGLARINPVNQRIIQFKASDGLQSDEFSDNAVWKDQTGMLFFGGIYGFNYFLPQNIHIDAAQPHLLVTDLQFAGRTRAEKGLQVLTNNGPVINQQFELGPQDNYFELNIQPIAYTNSQKCQYAYYLKGNDKYWHYIGNHEKIIYNNIAPGTYTLKVKWSNGEGAWTPAVSVFTVKVRQFFWLTPFAFFTYAVFAAVGVYLYYRYRKNKFLLWQKLRMEHMLREKDEKLHQEQLDFFTNIAHELQTPLTLISGSLERYLYKNKTQANGTGNYFLSVLRQETSRLHYLVLQLLEFRKAESGYLRNHFTYLNASELLSNISGLFNALGEAKEQQFTCHIESDINLWTDKDKLEKIIFNLISNAFKHAGEKQSIVFKLKRLNDTDMEIVVSNSGCQLHERDLPRLFDRFFVVAPAQPNKISSGIGLAFTRQLVELLNGSISVSINDGWIAFRVVLPLSFVPEQHELVADIGDKTEKPSYIFQSITKTGSHLPVGTVAENNKKAIVNCFEQEDKKMILVVEDEERIRFLLKDILSEQYIVYEAATGKEALEVIHRITPDLIISDIMMPDLNGLELCNIVKTTPATCQIPFVILSARGTLEQKTEGYECGADAYIPKPFQTEHLLVRVHKLLEYREKLHSIFTEQHKAASHLEESDIKDSDKNFIEKVLNVIEENIDADLDSAFLEKALNLSRIQLYRKIKTLSNMTPTELVRHVRLQKSALLLKSSDLTVSEIFYRTGFNNKTYFFREFKKMYNCSPNAYRAQHRLPDLN